MVKDKTLKKEPIKQIKRSLREEGFNKGYRGLDLEYYSKGFPIPENRRK